jgi:hypothetical protein
MAIGLQATGTALQNGMRGGVICFQTCRRRLIQKHVTWLKEASMLRIRRQGVGSQWLGAAKHELLSHHARQVGTNPFRDSAVPPVCL